MATTRAAIAALLIAAWPGPAAVPGGDHVFRHDDVMGTSMELAVRAVDRPAAIRAEGRALGEIDRLSAILSNHDPASEFRRWQAAPRGPVGVSAELFAVLEAAESWRDRSGGAFDPRADALSRLWLGADRADRLPDPADLAATSSRIAGPAWRLDASRKAAERLSDLPMTLDAIAKGFIVERACGAALAGDPAVEGVALNVGGDLRVQGAWARTIAITEPRAGSESTEPLALVEVNNRAVATSGHQHRGYRVGGRWYSHILDPRTGEPASGVLSASVIADRSADADALATILNVLTPAEGLRLADALPGVACLIIDARGRVHRNAAWPAPPGPPPEAVAVAVAGAEGGWGDDHELLVRFEINRPQEKGRYRRPYVAVWVEDQAGAPVRNLLLWVSMGGPGPFEWLPDLKRWYAVDRARTKANKTDVFQVAQPTRPPGSYSVLWDGKDDQGRPVPAGTYTVQIEAVREQGGYGLIRGRVTLAAEAFTREYPGNDEIKSATIEYRRRGAAR